jgi:uncharacterized protein (DUF58 family)
MNPYIRPIKNLPPGVTGHLEITNILPKRDSRDTAIGVGALVGVVLIVLPYVFLWHPLGMAIGLGVLFYVARAAAQLRIFTPIEQCSIRAVIAPMNPAERSPEDRLAMVEETLAASPADERAISGSNGKVVNGY